jgi:hypothetical protein
MLVSKDKKKKKDKKSTGRSSSTLKSLASNPMVADIVATALVATASALKDSKRARALATEASDELVKLSKSGVKSGEALWEMALQIGRRSLDELVGGSKATKSVKPAKPRKPAKAKKVAPKSTAKRTSTGGRKR